MERLRTFIGLILVFFLVMISLRTGEAQNPSTATHRAVGSWFGRAVQLCDNGVGPSVCVGTGRPADVLFMTPTLMPDGLFIADDTLIFRVDHTTAHGRWKALSESEFLADYVFILPTVPGTPPGSLAGLRARWQGQVLDDDTLVGHVNAFFTAGIPNIWQRLADDEFPAIPDQALPLVTAPSGFTLTPQRCANPGTPGCPLVFKFTLKRITY
jgi:hypothetical protein